MLTYTYSWNNNFLKQVSYLNYSKNIQIGIKILLWKVRNEHAGHASLLRSEQVAS